MSGHCKNCGWTLCECPPNPDGQPQPISELAPASSSQTWPHVLAFAKRMEAKLELNRHKGDRAGWLEDDIDDLLERLREEVCELDTAICAAHGSSEFNRAWLAKQVADEAADVANFALFISDWWMSRAESASNRGEP